jgi:hypothetical protein
MASMGQALGVPGWVLGTAGAVGFAAGAAGTLYSAWGEQKAVQNQLALQQPLMPSQVQAQFGDTMGANAVAIRHGDLGRSWAISQVKKTATYNEVQSERYKQHIQEQIKLEAPVGLKEAAETGRLGKIWDSVTSRLGAGVAVAVKHPLDSLKELGASAVDAAGAGIGFNRGTLGIKNQNFLGAVNDVIPADAAKRQMALRDHAADQVRARQELVNNFMRANPQVMTDMNEFYGSALGDQGLARAGGVSGGFRYNKKTKQWRDSLSDFEQGARNMGISGAERAGFEQTMGAQAGRGFFYNGASLLSPQAGGLSNAAQIFGVGAQFNGGGGWGGAQSFMGGIQGKIGRGGLDVTAGVQVANTGMAAMTSGRFQASGGGGVMSALMDAAGGGSTGRDMRNARMVSSGFGAMDQQVLGGGLDPLQKALNYSSAMEVGGHLPWATQKALANMDAATVAEVMRNPNSAQANALKSKGITADLLRDYFKSSNSKTFTRVTSDMLTGSQQQAMASFQAAGGSTSYMKGMIGSLAAAKKMSPGKARNRAMASAQSALDAAESDLATIFEMDRGWDTEKSLGYVKTLMGIEGTSGAVSGRGASRPDSMKTVRGGAIRKGGQFIGDKGTRLANLEHGLDAEGKPLKGADGQLLGGKALSDAIASMTPEAKREDAAAAAASKAAGGGDLNATIDQLGDILRKFVGQLHGSVGGAAGPPG